MFWQSVKTFNVEAGCTYWLLNVPPVSGLKNCVCVEGLIVITITKYNSTAGQVVTICEFTRIPHKKVFPHVLVHCSNHHIHTSFLPPTHVYI
jgi:hypothetical protein